jgi:hypothetical protein
VTEELKISIERLYSTFARYPFRSTIEGCPCCVSNEDKEKLHTKQLRLLEEDDISRYAFKAMTTWGDTDDFKHYLPRIFELLSTTDFIVDTFVVLGKLKYGNWTNWEKDEQEAVRDFLFAWWTDLLKSKSYFDKEAFVEIYKLIGEVDPLLARWPITFDDNSFKNYIDLLHDYYSDLKNKRHVFKEVDKNATDKLLQWLTENREIIERGFFHYEPLDKDFAEKISNTLYIMERA